MRSLLAGLIVAAALSGVAAAQPFPAPLVIGHRGAAGERPEHTLTGYRLAVAEGADFIEPDLVMTKDGVLIDRHEPEIGGTTNVAAHPEFAARKTTKMVDGHAMTGWFAEDFTLAEIKTLRARERLPELRRANTAYDGQDQVLTFQEVIDIAKAEGAKAGRVVGVYAELKHPTYFAKAGLPMEAAFVKVVKANGLDRRDAPFYFQCFELTPLRTVRGLMSVKTVFLMDNAGAPADLVAAGDRRTYADLAKPAELKAMAPFVDGIGPSTDLIVPRDAKGASLPPTTLIADAHAAGIVVHPFTFRAENYFLPLELRRAEAGKPVDPAAYGDLHAQFLQYFRLGVDGVFTDFPDLGVAARKDFLAAR